MRDVTVLNAELDLTAFGEGEDPALGVEHILLSPIPGADLPLGVEGHHALGVEKVVYHAPQVRHTLGVEHRRPLGVGEVIHLHALGVEQAIGTTTNRNPGAGVTRDHEARVIHIPGAEQDILYRFLGAEHLVL